MTPAALAALLPCVLAAAALAAALPAGPGAQAQQCYTVSCDHVEKVSRGKIEVVGRVEASGHLDTAVKLSGYLPAGHDGTVHVRIKPPEGAATVHTVGSSAQGYWEVYHTLPAGPQQGIYRAGAEYLVAAGYDKTGRARYSVHGLQPSTFYVEVPGTAVPDAEVVVRGRALDRECHGRGDCFGRGASGWHVGAGEVVRFSNRTDETHRMRAVSVSDGLSDGAAWTRVSDRMDPRLKANAFDTNVLVPGASVDVTLPSGGTGVLFACLYHGWLQGLVTVAPGGGGGGAGKPPQPLPDTIPELPRGGVGGGPAEAGRGGGGDGDPPARGVLVVSTGGGPYGNDGEKVTANILSVPDTRAKLRLLGPGGGEIKKWDVPVGGDGGGRQSFRAQPTWAPGEYTLEASRDKGYSHGVTATTTFEIRRAVSCIVPDPDMCYASVSGGVSEGGIITARGSSVRLAIVSVDGIPDLLEERCGIGETVVIQKGGGGGGALAWCGGGDGPTINQMLLDGGHAAVDRGSCGRTGLDAGWIMEACAVPGGGGDGGTAGGSGGGGPQPGGDCPVALAAYGTGLAHHVQVLREHRDAALGGRAVLHAAHAAYYAVAPHLADAMRGDPAVMSAVRAAVAVPAEAASYAARAVG